MKRSKCWVKYDAWDGTLQKQSGDCTVRAVAAARGVSYLEAWQQLYVLQGETGQTAFLLSTWLRTHPARFGVVRALSFPAVRGRARMTAETFCVAHPTGRFILKMAHHVATVRDGQLLDVWNSSSRCVYAAWEVTAVAVEQVA
jgi:hypothetical protein